MEKLIIKIDEKEFVIKQSFRALMLFEDMTSKTVNQMSESVADVLKLFYCILKGNNMNTFNYDFESFLDTIDEHPEYFQVFTEYLTEQAKGIPVTEQKKRNNKK